MKDLIKKIGGFSLGPVVGAFIGFITVPLITYFISPEEYGKTSMFVLAQGTVSMLIYMGLNQAFVREYNALKDDVNKLMVNAATLPIIAVLMLDVFIIIFQHPICLFLFDDSTEKMPLYALVALLPFMVIEDFALLKIRMEEKGLLYSTFTILLKTFGLAFTLILLLTYQKSFRSVIYALALAEIINGICLYLITMRNIKFRRRFLDKILMKKMLAFGLPLIPATVIGWVLTSMDKVMLRTMCSYEELGLYAAAFKIASALCIIQTCFTLFWTPVAYRWYESGKDNYYFEIVSKAISITMTVMCLLLLEVKPLVGFVLGKNFTQAIYIFPFLVLFPIMYTISETTALGIGFTRQTKYNIVVSAISGATNIALNYALIPVFQGTGAAIATGVSYIVFFWARTLISRKLWWKFPIGKYAFMTAVIIVNCTLHSFAVGVLPYIVSAASIILVAAVCFGDIRELRSIAAGLTKEVDKCESS